ncbi:hypothetical protein AGMMS49982_13460 [Bacteroidia bacterium]|nr:hypothetical protein AGMMS49982_13460 [Bacteroidia bacterium]
MAFIAFGFFYSCVKGTNNAVDIAEAEKEARQTILMLGMIPDSLRSPEQKTLAKNLDLLVHEHCLVKNNHLEVAISKKEFETIGVPEIYYNILKKDIENINHYLDTTTSTIFTADFMMDAFRESMNEYFAAKGLNHLE